MHNVGTKLRQRVCSHDYELQWMKVDGEMKGFRCTRCGHTLEE